MEAYSRTLEHTWIVRATLAILKYYLEGYESLKSDLHSHYM